MDVTEQKETLNEVRLNEIGATLLSEASTT